MTGNVLWRGGIYGLLGLTLASGLGGQVTSPATAVQGIPVTDPVVIAKCGSCHKSDAQQNMERVSFVRGTPESWQDMVRAKSQQNRLNVTADEARAIVKYLSDTHGLAPQEIKPVAFLAERRVREETGLAPAALQEACGKCHPLARTLSSRRSAAEWKLLTAKHAADYKAPATDAVLALLNKAAPLHTPEWDAWSARSASSVTGRWLMTAHLPGGGNFYGLMEVQQAGTGGELSTRTKLQSIADGATVMRSGRIVVYGGHAWRGRSQGMDTADLSSDPSNPGNAAREVMSFSADQTTGEGRWFWGQYQEFGFDISMQRAGTELAVMGMEGTSMKIGSPNNVFRIIGANFPADLKLEDLDLGPGLTVKRLQSRGIEIMAFIDVAADAKPGPRDVVLKKAGVVVLKRPGAAMLYDRVDYVKVIPESSLAAFADTTRPRGFQQFEAIGYQRGADGKLHTADDVPLGPVEATWSSKVFYATDDAASGKVGTIDQRGLYTPAAENPNTNFDVWAVATATEEKDKAGEPLVGKGYITVTVPSYVMRGRRYVRDLDRWVDDGPATAPTAPK